MLARDGEREIGRLRLRVTGRRTASRATARWSTRATTRPGVSTWTGRDGLVLHGLTRAGARSARIVVPASAQRACSARLGVGGGRVRRGAGAGRAAGAGAESGSKPRGGLSVRIVTPTSAVLRATAPIQLVGEALRDARVLPALPQRDHDQLAAWLVLDADVDEVGSSRSRTSCAPRSPVRCGRRRRPSTRVVTSSFRVQRAPDSLEVALGGVVGYGDEGHSSFSSPITGDSGSSATLRIAEQDAGHEARAVRRLVADRERLGDVAEDHVLVGDDAWQADGVDRHVAVHQQGRCGRPCRTACRPSREWWYLMISALAHDSSRPRRRSASSARRRSRSWARRTPLPGGPSTASRSLVLGPAGRADHDVHPRLRGRRARSPTAWSRDA